MVLCDHVYRYVIRTDTDTESLRKPVSYIYRVTNQVITRVVITMGLNYTKHEK